VMTFHDRQSSERCIRKLISRHCFEKTRTRWNDFLFLITDDRDFRPQTCTNGLVFRGCKHIKNIFEDVYFTKNSFHITLSRPFWKCNVNLFFYHFLKPKHWTDHWNKENRWTVITTLCRSYSYQALFDFLLCSCNWFRKSG
jgi:hypothetical protein